MQKGGGNSPRKAGDATAIKSPYTASVPRFDITNYSIIIPPETIRHIENRHGANEKADHSMADPSDLARIGYVLNNYDTIVKEHTGSKGFSNADGKPAAKVLYSKRVNGTYYVVEAVPNTKAHTVQVVSAYKIKATSPAPLTYAVGSTSNNAPANVALNPNVPQGNNGVNAIMPNLNGKAAPMLPLGSAVTPPTAFHFATP